MIVIICVNFFFVSNGDYLEIESLTIKKSKTINRATTFFFNLKCIINRIFFIFFYKPAEKNKLLQQHQTKKKIEKKRKKSNI